VAVNSRGQAALTDALYFLLIVSILSTMLFFYAANYGAIVRESVVNQYLKEYATGALGTILYSSTPRIAGQVLDDATEVDYLLAAVKEDFADDGKIVETGPILSEKIYGIMQPITGNFDYLFFFYLFEKKTFPLVVLFTREDPSGTSANAEIYFCYPPTMNDLQAVVDDLGSSAQSDAIIQFVRLDEDGHPTYPAAQANLTIWVSTPIHDKLAGLNCALHRTIASD